MDNLVLMRVAAVLSRALERGVLEDVGAEGLHRFRLGFATERGRATLVVSLRPELPWIGRPSRPRRGAWRREEPFAAQCRRTLAGAVLRAVEKLGPERSIVLRFGDGHALVAELATHGANLVLLAAGDEVAGAARHPRAARERLDPGKVYRPRDLPRGLVNPFEADAELLDGVLERSMRDGESLLESIRRRLFGIGTVAAELVVAESRDSGRSPGSILAGRLRDLEDGRLDPVVVGPLDPASPSVDGVDVDVQAIRLLPWEPPRCERALKLHDAAATAGLYHEAVELGAEVAERLEALRSILDKEIERLLGVENKVSADLRGFDDPDRFRRWGEALLAGLGAAERFGEQVRVPDPYDPESRLVVPAPGGLSLPQVADLHFKAHRRARRGRDAARRRLEEVAARRVRLDRLRQASADARGSGGARDLEESMRTERIPVGLAKPRRKREAPDPQVRVEGVRMFTGLEGETILVGRTGQSNDRLTFKIAAPDDFWLHVQGRPGAHVVIRNPEGRAKPARGTLEQAAVLAAWFSTGREDSGVDVHWTRRKHVRRVRGAPPGTVIVKRSETVRVRPRPPREE